MTRQRSVSRADIGIIGGSGLYEIEGFRKVKELAVKTPFGAPSDKVLVTGLRFLSSKTTTRILLELSQEAKYEIGRIFGTKYFV